MRVLKWYRRFGNSYRGFRFQKGSEVIVPCNTFIATAESVVRNNLKVKFVDINKNLE